MGALFSLASHTRRPAVGRRSLHTAPPAKFSVYVMRHPRRTRFQQVLYEALTVTGNLE